MSSPNREIKATNTASSGADPTVQGPSQRSATDTKGNPNEDRAATTDMHTTSNKSGNTTLANLETDGMTAEQLAQYTEFCSLYDHHMAHFLKDFSRTYSSNELVNKKLKWSYAEYDRRAAEKTDHSTKASGADRGAE
jgi:hypothetical protein